jgi:hypothetical protein
VSGTEVFDAVGELARRSKVDRTKRWREGADEQDCDLHGHVVVVRNGRPTAVLYAGPSGPHGMRRAAYIAAVLLRPDELVTVTDAVRMVNPDLAGSVLGVRAGDLVMRWQAGYRDNLTEALVLLRIGRTGVLGARDYRYTRTGSLVLWGDVAASDNGEGYHGPAVDHAAAGFADAAHVWDTELADGLRDQARLDGLPPEQQEYFTDRNCAAMASEYDRGMCKLLDTGDVFIDGQELQRT